jgi:hypothetical protein
MVLRNRLIYNPNGKMITSNAGIVERRSQQ